MTPEEQKYKNRSESMKKMWQDPIKRQNLLNGLKKGANSPEKLKIRAEVMRVKLSGETALCKLGGTWPNHDPEVRAKQLQTQMLHWSDKEWREARWSRMREEGRDSKAPKLTDQEARQVLIMLSEGYRVKEICEAFGVSQPIISYIKSGKTYKHVKV